MTITDIPQRHSRRAIVAGLAAMIPAATASVAMSTPAHPDAELVALGEQVVNLRFQSEAADEEYARFYKIYKEICPERPRALLWHPGDPVGYQWDRPGNGKATVWCNLDEVERLRGRTSFIEWLFNGTREQWEALRLPNWEDKGIKPVVGYEHLFLSTDDKHRAKRARKLLAALDEYNAAEEAADVASGCRAAEEVATRCMRGSTRPSNGCWNSRRRRLRGTGRWRWPSSTAAGLEQSTKGKPPTSA